MHLKHDNEKEAKKWAQSIDMLLNIYRGKSILDFESDRTYQDSKEAMTPESRTSSWRNSNMSTQTRSRVDLTAPNSCKPKEQKSTLIACQQTCNEIDSSSPR
eukprot:GABU01006566.1.p1 GENE.GABU01006566.1~~GABU01006566.1.p1  ORF type:complete len:114 (-),score=28.79 GABU01006566.1:72-377(-)